MILSNYKLVTALIGITIFAGAGCAGGETIAPGYLKDAVEFGAYTNSGIIVKSGIYVPPDPAVVPPADLDSTSTISKPTTTTVTATPKKPRPITILDIAPAAENEYTKVVRAFGKSGFLFQFKNCHGTPGVLTVKKGTNIMLDNRDGRPRQFKVGPDGYLLAAYGYAIITAKRTGTNYITCDRGGAATLFVQP